MTYDVIGIGSPLIDLTVQIEDDLLSQLGIKKGSMNLFAEEQLEKTLSFLEKNILKISPGDSTANAIAGIANFGGSTAYIGKVGNDKHGDFFIEHLVKSKIQSRVVKTEAPTGKVVALITPDSERTMIVALGAAKLLNADDIKEEDISEAAILHMTGYQLEDPGLRAAALKAMDIAKEKEVQISIDLADAELVKRNLDLLKDLVTKYADIVFANEEEAEVFTGKKEYEALMEIYKMCSVAIVKLGAKGSIIHFEDTTYEIDSHKVKAVDTTGAGDMYAAGILFGITHDFSMEKSGKLASRASAKVVAQIGARIEEDLKPMIDEL